MDNTEKDPRTEKRKSIFNKSVLFFFFLIRYWRDLGHMQYMHYTLLIRKNAIFIEKFALLTHWNRDALYKPCEESAGVFLCTMYLCNITVCVCVCVWYQPIFLPNLSLFLSESVISTFIVVMYKDYNIQSIVFPRYTVQPEDHGGLVPELSC